MRPRHALGFVLVGALVAACGTSPAGNSQQKLLGIVSISANEFANAQTIKGATAAAKAKGWKVSVIDAQGSTDQANSAIKNLVARGANAIFDLVFPATAIGAGLTSARQAKVPVASWGGGMGPGIVMDTGQGAAIAKPVIKAMLADMKSKGSVLALTYHGGQVCRDREALFDSMLKGSGLTVTKNEVGIPGFQQQAQKYANSWLSGHPKNSGRLAIWGCWDGPALGAASALRQAGRTDVKTYGANGGPAAIAAVQKGNLTATEWENSEAEGKAMFDSTLEAIKAGSSWKPKQVNVPSVLVTKATVAAFIKKHPHAIG